MIIINFKPVTIPRTEIFSSLKILKDMRFLFKETINDGTGCHEEKFKSSETVFKWTELSLVSA